MNAPGRTRPAWRSLIRESGARARAQSAGAPTLTSGRPAETRSWRWPEVRRWSSDLFLCPSAGAPPFLPRRAESPPPPPAVRAAPPCSLPVRVDVPLLSLLPRFGLAQPSCFPGPVLKGAFSSWCLLPPSPSKDRFPSLRLWGAC